jgi:predicted ATPase/class 3 adenylate cyclase
MTELPTGTVTFLFTDIEGSTALLQELGPHRYRDVAEGHGDILRQAIEAGGGGEVRTEGDSFFAAFPTPIDAVHAAVQAQRDLAARDWPASSSVRVRMGLHTGEGVLGGDDYIGLDVHRAARIASAAHGGQVLISSTTVELVREGLSDDLTLRDLGRHRLKDLARPERIFQLTIGDPPAEFPPIRSLETPTNLPVQRTGFVGREEQVQEVKRRLRGPGLLTLTGPGGGGKTRLALESAGELLDDYPDGVFVAELAPITDPSLVPSAFAEALGVKSEGLRPVLDTLRDELRDRETLVVADNFEQVIAAAPVVGDLLDAAPRLRILATSREPLHIAGEQELPVPPLELPDAVALFAQRAAAIDPDFRLTGENDDAVAELCRRLDGLPLAIELAASRIKTLSPAAILDRLGHRLELLTGGPVDLPARQRTLRAAIAWSVDLLRDDERALFRRLAVFAGGWSMEVAATVGDLAAEPIDLLASLVDKSLVTRVPSQEVRFGMLGTIRAFGIEGLEAAGEADATRERHATVYLELAEAAEPHLRGLDQVRWLDELELEHDNVRAAMRWAIDTGHVDIALRLVGALWRFWHLHGHLDEGRHWAEQVLALPGTAGRTAQRAKALTALGGVAYWQEDLAATGRAYREALDIVREIGDRQAEAEALYNLSFVPAYEGDIDEAVAILGKALALSEELGSRRGVADGVWLMAIVARLEGDTATARARAEESLRMHREIGDRFGTTDALHVLGRIALAQRDLAIAGSSFLEALTYDEEVGNRTGMGIVLDNLAAKASAEDRHLRAVRLAGASEAIKEAAGGHAPPPFIDLPDPRDSAREVLGEAAVTAAWEEGQAMTLEQAVAYARSADD